MASSARPVRCAGGYRVGAEGGMVSLHPSVLAPCPRCGADVWTFCWDCRAYVSDLSAEKPHSVGAVAPEATPQKASVVLQDNRTEKEIEAAVIFALETLGFKAWKVSQPRATMQAEGLGSLYYGSRQEHLVRGKAPPHWRSLEGSGPGAEHSAREVSGRGGSERRCLHPGALGS